MITSIENPKIKYILKLSLPKYRKKDNKFLVEGKHLVEEARKQNLLEEAFSLEDKEGYTQISSNVMKKICNTDTLVSEIGICKMLDSIEPTNKILALDAIQDPGNMGTLLRSAVAFNFTTIIVGTGCVDVYNDKVIRSSQGAIFKLNFLFKNLVDFIPTLKEYEIYGTNVVQGIELDQIETLNKVLLILGNEGNGISKEVQNILNKNIYIPMNNTESLNVGVAGSIIMYKLRG